MSEKTYLRPCCFCSSSLNITLDTITEDITIRPENLPPLAKDCLEIVAVYKRLKGLGADWQKLHGSRGVVHAGELIQAAGPLGGAQERVIGLLTWLKESGKDFDLGSASSYLMAYSRHLADKMASSRGRCLVCSESYWNRNGIADNCGRHD